MNDNLLLSNDLVENIDDVNDIIENNVETLNFDNDEIEDLEPNFTKIVSDKIINDLDFDSEEIEEITDIEIDDYDESNNLMIADFDDENDNDEIEDEIINDEIRNQDIGNNEQSMAEDKKDDNVIEKETINKLDNIENNDLEQVNKKEANNEISNEEEQKETNNIEIENQNKVDYQPSFVIDENSLLAKYGENLSIKKYVCNPAIGRDNEIKQLILTLLTPEKSGILVGKPGIGKTAIVEGLGYCIQNRRVPDALKDYQIYKLNTSSLLGIMPGTNEPKIQVLLSEIKGKEKLILFIDEIHTLIGAGADGNDSLDFANIFKPGLDRGNIKIIGATTTDEYDRYILTDKAFVRRFQKIDVLEPTKEHTVKILMGSLPKLEYKTGAKLKYTEFIQEKIMTFIVDLTTEYRRVYELSARYPDVALTILQQAFSYAVFDNKKEVGIRDIRKAIYNTKLVYPDVIKKELIRFNELFSDIYLMETKQRLKGE